VARRLRVARRPAVAGGQGPRLRPLTAEMTPALAAKMSLALAAEMSPPSPYRGNRGKSEGGDGPPVRAGWPGLASSLAC
jgi:hypothetical protein